MTCTPYVHIRKKNEYIVEKLVLSKCNIQKRWKKLAFFVKCKVHIFWEGHKILQNLPLTFDCSTYLQSKVRGRFRKILWPSQNVWTLTRILILHVTNEKILPPCSFILVCSFIMVFRVAWQLSFFLLGSSPILHKWGNIPDEKYLSLGD